MPELPDVENYCRYLHDHAGDRTIADVAVNSPRVLDGVSGPRFVEAVRGRRFGDMRRHGKHLLAALDDGQWLAFHFGMTGRFVFFDTSAGNAGADPRHDRLRFDLGAGAHLAFVNQRLLGRVRLVDGPDAFIAEKNLGPDALVIDEAAFKARFARRKGVLKSALMDQSLVAGIGNIFSDEILFQARLHPKAAAGALDDADMHRLFTKMRHVLETAIDKGAGDEDFPGKVPQSWLLARRKAGAACPRCSGRVETLKMQGRTAYYCPACQAAPDA